MLRKLIGAVAILSLVAGPAAAQIMPSFSPFKKEEKKLTPEEIEQQKQRDKDYNAAMAKIPEKKSNDPWGNLRDAPQTTNKPNKPPQ
jgi:hypothetical protein